VNGDGALDLFVDNGAEHPPFGVGPRELFLNAPNGNHWVRLQLRGLVSNGSGIGARVRFVGASGERWRFRLGESENCFSNDAAIHCGLGTDTVIDTLQIFWPSGIQDTFEQLQVDRTYVAIEGKPLRPPTNPHFIVMNPPLGLALQVNQTALRPVTVDNFGGVASSWVASYEDRVTDLPITWLSLDADSGAVWPGGTPPLALRIDANGLGNGDHYGRVVFDSNSFLGPDTLNVNLHVTDPAVGVEETAGRPERFALSRPCPNPARREVSLELGLPEAAPVEVGVYDVAGRRVATLLRGVQPAGYRRAVWDLRDGSGHRAAPGLYLVRARCDGESLVRKVVITH
jgi:hypothetical protein